MYKIVMSVYADKIKNGILPSDEDWNQYLRETHKANPSMTPKAYANFTTQDGRTSYGILAASLPITNPNPTILDLACGDGYLSHLLLPQLGENGKVIGIDMSEGELAVARKTFSGERRIEFKSALAQDLPLPDHSVDAITCHMAIMLMLPLDPVIREIHRVLKSGAPFSAVIGNTRGQPGFMADMMKLVFDFITDRYPNAQFRTGDERVRSLDSLKELFSSRLGFKGDLFHEDFSLSIATPPKGVWNFIKDMYMISMLTHTEQERLKEEIQNFSTHQITEQGLVEFEFQMRMFTAWKE